VTLALQRSPRTHATCPNALRPSLLLLLLRRRRRRRQVAFTSVAGSKKTAVLTDAVDASALTALYTGFSGFTLLSVFHARDAASAIPSGGLTIGGDSADATYTNVQE
jgi:hypothetical protein